MTRSPLVSIERKTIDSNKITGFILKESDDLVLLSYVYDFNLDGIMVLRKKDISSMRSTETDIFQTKLIKQEGDYSQIDFNPTYNVSSWFEFFNSAIRMNKYFIVERETLEEPDLAIGKVNSVEKTHLKLQYFTGVARWLEEIESLKYQDITSCQIGNNYLNVYERHFESE